VVPWGTVLCIPSSLSMRKKPRDGVPVPSSHTENSGAHGSEEADETPRHREDKREGAAYETWLQDHLLYKVRHHSCPLWHVVLTGPRCKHGG